MAPYAVAHFKLGLQLAALDLPEAQRKAWAYDFQGDERVGVYLTNTLEGPHEHTGLPLFTQFLARETDAADRIKQDLPVLVIFGNPPYSGHSANKGKWIEGLLKGQLPDGTTVSSYYQIDGRPLEERQSKWLHDDYVKFIRWAQWRIEKTGSGILAFITNHSYLDNPTFRGMRRALMQSFTDIYILDLHGNAKKREVAPGGGKDENVFDIQQGVAIGIFVKEPGKTGPAQVHHAELWGKRQDKYDWLLDSSLETTSWRTLDPQPPMYFFTPQNTDLLAEYQQGWKVTDVFPVNSVGIVTARDRLTIHLSTDDVWKTVKDFASISAEEAREKYRLGSDARDWKVQLAQEDLRGSGPAEDRIEPILYRPFDKRFTYYTGRTRGFICMPMRDVMQHALPGNNLGLIVPRRVELVGPWMHCLASNVIIDHVVVSLKTIDSLLQLYLFPVAEKVTAKQSSWLNTSPWPPDAHGRVPNLAPAFVAEVEARLGMKFLTSAGRAPTPDAPAAWEPDRCWTIPSPPKTSSATSTPSSMRRRIAAATPSSSRWTSRTSRSHRIGRSFGNWPRWAASWSPCTCSMPTPRRPCSSRSPGTRSAGTAPSKRGIRATMRPSAASTSARITSRPANKANTSRACRPKSGTSRSAATNRARNGSKIAWAASSRTTT